MTTDEIKALIPHRDPFLWIDEVVELSESRLVAIKRLPADLDVFRGHYPHFPVLPGALQCEAAMQAAAVLIAHSLDIGADRVPVATRMNNVQFRRLVRPGDTLDIEVTLTERLKDAFYLKGRVSVAGRVTTRLEFACTAADVPRD